MYPYAAPRSSEPSDTAKVMAGVLGALFTPVGLALTCYGIGLRFFGSIADAFEDAFNDGTTTSAGAGSASGEGALWLLVGVAILFAVATTAGIEPLGAGLGGSVFGVLPGIYFLAASGTDEPTTDLAPTGSDGGFDATTLVVVVAGTTHLFLIGGLLLVGAALASAMRGR